MARKKRWTKKAEKDLGKKYKRFMEELCADEHEYERSGDGWEYRACLAGYLIVDLLWAFLPDWSWKDREKLAFSLTDMLYTIRLQRRAEDKQ